MSKFELGALFFFCARTSAVFLWGKPFLLSEPLQFLIVKNFYVVKGIGVWSPFFLETFRGKQER